MKLASLAHLLHATRVRPVLARALRWSGVLCLNYHRIGNAETSLYDRDLWSATAAGFDEQVRWLKSHFDIISPDDLPDVLARRRGRFVMITFDDGYRDNYELAFPILRRHGVRATFFIATSFIDEPRVPWWDEVAWMVRRSQNRSVSLTTGVTSPLEFDEPDREVAIKTLLRAYKSRPATLTGAFLEELAVATGSGRHPPHSSADTWMTWDMVRELRAGGMSIGGHTVNHPILARMSREAQAQEIFGCCHRIAEMIGEPVRSFSYPIGKPDAFDAQTLQLLLEAGVQFAFSYYGGYRTFSNWDNHDIRRVAVEREITPNWFQARVLFPRLF